MKQFLWHSEFLVATRKTSKISPFLSLPDLHILEDSEPSRLNSYLLDGQYLTAVTQRLSLRFQNNTPFELQLGVQRLIATRQGKLLLSSENIYQSLTMNTSSTYFSPISSSPSSYPIYHFPRTELIPGFSDVYFSIVAPFVAYWIVSFLFLLIDISGLSIFERHRIHAPEETKSKNKVTMKQVIWAVLFQQVIQTALGLAWLREDDPAFGPFRDHGDSIDKYSKVTASLAVALLGKTLGSEAVKRYGTSLGTWLYWWGIPTVQFLFAA